MRVLQLNPGAHLLLPLLLMASVPTIRGLPYSPVAEVKTLARKGVAITGKLTDFVPSLSDVAAAGKYVVLGMPFQFILEGLNQVCSLAQATDGDLERPADVVPELGDVHVKFLDNKYNRSYGVESVSEMLQLETFNKNNPTVVVTTGWLSMRGNRTSKSAEKLLRAYQCRGDYNFILFDSGEYIATIYSWSARNTETLGVFLGEFLVEMGRHMDMAKVHLVGHSLGAQISGEAGRTYQARTHKLLPRITALDPARPCFNEGEVLNGVGRGDAQFVDVIHTNSGALGQRLPIGDADFYPNGVTILQPGSLHIGSSHKRAIELYAESVLPGNEETFLATKCNSLYSLTAELCPRVRAPMGFAATPDKKGNFFLRTAAKAPYGERQRNTCDATGQVVVDNDDADVVDAEAVVPGDNATTKSPGQADIAVDETTRTTTKKARFMGVFG